MIIISLFFFRIRLILKQINLTHRSDPYMYYHFEFECNKVFLDTPQCLRTAVSGSDAVEDDIQDALSIGLFTSRQKTQKVRSKPHRQG